MIPAAGGTVFAPATAPGRAALGIIRISGPHAALACRELSGRPPPPSKRASLRTLREPGAGPVLDRAVLLWSPGPASSTGEDVLEIQHHGGPAVQAGLLEALSALPGYRLAQPGELTRRAFLNGKLDLTEVEALADLIDAGTSAQARQALRQLDGALGRLYGGWRERLLAGLSLIEAELDFAAESEVPDAMLDRVRPEIEALQDEMRAHLADGHRGERLRAGLVVAVIGAPNAGKSSLVNLLARREVALVTPIPGTTRDVIEVQLDLDGLPVTLLDTAGLRPTEDPVEAAGIARARARAATADLRLGLVDASAPDWDSVEGADLLAVSKIDLFSPPPGTGIPICCTDGRGLPELLSRLTAAARELASPGDTPVITRARHREAVTNALAHLNWLLAADQAGSELVLLAEELRLATRALGQIMGVVTVEEVLDRIFAGFCIGK